MKLIDEVLELDKKSTPAPWLQTTIGVVVDSKAEELIASTSGKLNTDDALITHYRTAAPKLARALKLALEALWIAQTYGLPADDVSGSEAWDKLRNVRAEVEEILK